MGVPDCFPDALHDSGVRVLAASMTDREHAFDHNGGVAAHRSDCWCVEREQFLRVWEQRVREAAARNRKITDTQPVEDESEEFWWQR